MPSVSRKGKFTKESTRDYILLLLIGLAGALDEFFTLIGVRVGG